LSFFSFLPSSSVVTNAPLYKVHIPLDPLSKTPKGLAYVSFTKGLSAVAAYEKLDGRSFQGRLLHILPAVDRKAKFSIEEGEGRKKSLKETREGEKKKMAGRGFNWGMLYMNVRPSSF
jgi:multiple RNA-binding domain-containing protein 1